jgi:hypothetical protein
MAIWDDSTVTTVGTSITPLVQEVPNLARNAILRAILGDLPIAETIIGTLLAGYTIKPFSYYREGSSGRYPLGLPSGGNGDTANIQVDAVKDVIATIEGLLVADITYQSIRYAQPTVNEIGYIVAANEYGLDKINGQVSNSGYTPPLSGYVVGIQSHAYLFEQTTETVDLITYLNVYDPNNEEATKTTLSQQDRLVFDLVDDQYAGIDDWVTIGTLVTYTIPDGSGGQSEPIIFFYNQQTATGLYPQLLPNNLAEIASPYFPIAPIRIDGQMVGDPEHAQVFYREDMGAAVTNILKYVNIDLPVLQEAVATNPDVNLIDDSYVMFALPLGANHQPVTITNPWNGQQFTPNVESRVYKESQPVLKYMFRYFEHLAEIQTTNKSDFDSAFIGYAFPATPPRADVPFNVLDIRDSELQQAVYWNYAEVTEIVYVAPDPEPIITIIGTGDVYNARGKSGAKYILIPTVDNRDLDLESVGYAFSKIGVAYYDDVNEKAYYAEIDGLYTQNDVIKDRVVLSTLYEAYFTTDGVPLKDGLALPLAYNILITLSIKEQGEVAYRGLILFNYAIQVTVVEWYQRPAFANLIRIGLVILALSGNPQFLAAELGFTEVLYIILEQIIIGELTSQLLSVLFPFIVDLIGLDAAKILAVIAIAVGTADALEIINVATFLPDAITLLQAGVALSNSVGQKTVEELRKIEQESNETANLISKAQDLVDEVLNKFPDVGISAYTLVDASLRVEYPTDFYNRTINPSIGLLSLDVIESYYSNALTTEPIGSST